MLPDKSAVLGHVGANFRAERNQAAPIAVWDIGQPAGKAVNGLVLRLSTRKAAGRREDMTYHTLFAALCAVLAANIIVAVIAIIKAYREEERVRRLSRFAPG